MIVRPESLAPHSSGGTNESQSGYRNQAIAGAVDGWFAREFQAREGLAGVFLAGLFSDGDGFARQCGTVLLVGDVVEGV